ncbi:uncharacterized protein LOC110461669 [Mizuhopecten yessoensis]|uniref:Zinc finger protein 782 n=1 Tax=Mizuhopecten yessoensis TaxID=6573 RepID=A0A210PZU8_MIZYE|nr:uncharacterized protein LOC110461669 [Mizuhopecten yessoensis]XP_021370916.1 uncharacterized protein LOC110461669 [Mizuhopecten yessoensis]OWF42023.1 Zinc finger protein 782 [Mizuhopecten yessoensis]
MDSSIITNVSKGPSPSKDELNPVSSKSISQTLSADQIPSPVFEVSLTGQESSPELSMHPAVMEIISDKDSSSNAHQISPTKILQNLSSAEFTQQSSLSSNEMSQNCVNLIRITTPPLHQPVERNVSHALAEDESTVSVLQQALSSQPENSWSVSSINNESVAERLQISLRQEQGFDTNQYQLRVQQMKLGGNELPWKPTAVTEQGINLEQHTTTALINSDKISPSSIVLQKAQEDFSVITQDSAHIQEETLPIDAVIETIEEYVDRATSLESEVSEPPNKAPLITEPIGSRVQQNADWNFDVNLAFDMHIKKHSENETMKVGKGKPQVITGVQSGKFTVTSKGLASPKQNSVSLIRNIPTSSGTSLVGRYQDVSTLGIESSDANRWEDRNLQFSLNPYPGNLLKVQYTEGEMQTVLQKASTDMSTGPKEQIIQPVLNTQPMEQPLHIQNEMHRLGLHVQIDKAADSDNVRVVNPGLGFIVPEQDNVRVVNPGLGFIVPEQSAISPPKAVFFATEEQSKNFAAGKAPENTAFSSDKNITSLEKNIAAMHSFVQTERARLDLERRAGLITIKPIEDIPKDNKSTKVTVGPTPVSLNSSGKEKTAVSMPTTSGVDSVNPVRREIARIVILPNQLGGKAELMVTEAMDGKSTSKKSLLVPVKNIYRGKQQETTDSAQVPEQTAEEGTSKTQQTGKNLQEKTSYTKEDARRKPALAVKPLTALTEDELSVLQRPKKITRYFKEKAKNVVHQGTKQQNVQNTSQEEQESKAPEKGLSQSKQNLPKELQQEGSTEKETQQFVLGDPNPTPVILLRNCAEVKSVKAFTCQECGRGFSHLGDYNSHVKAHKDGMPFTCNECGVGFRKSGHLINHSRRHTGEKPFACTFCNNKFGQLGTLKRHLRIHTGEKPYVCPTCNKSFSQLSYMKVHRRSHTGERPFKCDICEHSFLQSGDLKKHKLRKHNAKKELPCPHCSKSFGDKIDIKRHLKTHEGKLDCKTCNKKFENMESAKIHKQLFHSKGKTKELPHRCTMCDIGFKLKADLQSHMRTCHPLDIKKEKPNGRGKGKKRGRKRRKQQHESEDEDSDQDFEKDMSDTPEGEGPTFIVKEEVVDEEQKAKEEEEKKETVIRGTRKRKASKFQLRKLLPVNQNHPKRSRRSKNKETN